MAHGHWTKAILLSPLGRTRHQQSTTFLRPRWIKNQTRLHERFVFFSVLGGISVFGLLGIVLGPVVLAITLGFTPPSAAIKVDCFIVDGDQFGPVEQSCEQI